MAGVLAAGILLGADAAAMAQVRVGLGIAVPGLSIGINVPSYPELVAIPGYPVYYAPRLGVNLFFYDGLYWTYAGDAWYYSSWYDGPWYLAQPELVPDFILRVPIRYYRRPPPYFLHWNREGPPRWGEHWGPAWEQRRPGWDRWNRSAVPPRAPLPGFQRQFPRSRYPDVDRQRTLESRYYNYKPRDPNDRSRMEAPQWGRRIAPQPHRVVPESRRPHAPPNAARATPGSIQQPGVGRAVPPVRAGRHRSDYRGQPADQSRQQRGEAGPPGREPRRDQGHSRGDDRGGQQNRRPPSRTEGIARAPS